LENASRIALIKEEERITYAELWGKIVAFAGYLQERGITLDDKIAIMLPNCVEFVVSYFAAMHCGAVAVTISTVSAPRELQHILKDSESKVLITRATTLKRLTDTDTESDFLFDKEIILLESPADIPLASPAPLPEVSSEAVAVMIYTAGLAGKPLGAQLTHGNLLSQMPLLKEGFQGDCHDRALAVIPYFHAYGAAANLLIPLAVGGSVVIMEQFTLESIFATIAEEKVTYIAAVPRLFWGMLLHEGASKYDISSLRFLITGGSMASLELLEAFEKRFGLRIWEGYGLTEASPICSISRNNMPYKPGSMGIPISAVQVKIVDAKGKELPSGETGELLVKGANVMKGYYKAPAATAAALEEGWLHTGDFVRADADGYLFFKGLKKRMIITNGFNVYPREVEDVLEMFPSVARAVVVGKSDQMRGEIVCANVQPKGGCVIDERELLRFARKRLSPYKVPREITSVTML